MGKFSTGMLLGTVFGIGILMLDKKNVKKQKDDERNALLTSKHQLLRAAQICGALSFINLIIK